MIHTWFALLKDKLLTPATGHPVVVVAAVLAIGALLLGALIPLFLD